MESVSSIMKSSDDWENDIRNFWNALRSMFEVRKSITSCGSHIHLAPWKRNYTLKEAKTIAFACCYHERYVISCLPEERRDHMYCRRNTKVATKMGKLYGAKTTNGLVQIASDINALNSFKELVVYMHGSLDYDRRRVLWNFRNLYYGSNGTIEFRGGRHLRCSRKTVAWITFAVVFILMALDEVRH